jgi:hypothetical protein
MRADKFESLLPQRDSSTKPGTTAASTLLVRRHMLCVVECGFDLVGSDAFLWRATVRARYGQHFLGRRTTKLVAGTKWWSEIFNLLLGF